MKREEGEWDEADCFKALGSKKGVKIMEKDLNKDFRIYSGCPVWKSLMKRIRYWIKEWER